jgi:hypothetical protein
MSKRKNHVKIDGQNQARTDYMAQRDSELTIRSYFWKTAKLSEKAKAFFDAPVVLPARKP